MIIYQAPPFDFIDYDSMMNFLTKYAFEQYVYIITTVRNFRMNAEHTILFPSLMMKLKFDNPIAEGIFLSLSAKVNLEVRI